MNPTDWTAAEKRSAIAAGAAPLAVAVACAAVAALAFGRWDEFSLLIILIPFTYISCVCFVVPSLWVFRRLGGKSVWSFSAVCGLSAVAPWFFMYLAFFGTAADMDLNYGGAPEYVAALLFIPCVFAGAAGAVVWAMRPGPAVGGPSSSTCQAGD